MPNVSNSYADPSGRQAASAPMPGEEARAPVVLMVSGGADSTALLVLAATSRLDIADGRGKARIARERLHVLHVNHQLRALDAEEDEEFVRELSARYGIPCEVVRVDVRARAQAARETSAQGGNVEDAGRVARYEAARDLANRLSSDFGTPRSAARILTAHTADDRAETFFMNAIRGSGAPGLSSIPHRRNRVVRPLLDRTHDELCELLRMRGIVWREDETNRDTRYLRSFVRHEIMPKVRERNPRVVESIAATCDILSEEDAFLTQLAGRTFHDLVRRQAPTMVALDAKRLAATEVALARRVVRQAMLGVAPDARLESRHIARVLSLVAAGRGSATIPLGVDVRVEYGLLFVRAGERADAGERGAWLEVTRHGLAKTLGPGRLLVPGGELQARVVEVPRGSRAPDLAREHAQEWESTSVLLDAEACGVDPTSGGRLWVDGPQPGDVLCPFGMHGQSKKLSDLLNEARIPAADRVDVPVVRTSPTGEIVWVAPIRSDERVRCTPDSRMLVELTLVRN